MTQAFVPGGQAFHFNRVLSDEELAEWNRRRDERNAEIRKSSILMIKCDEAGNPLPSPDASEEERWAAADARGAVPGAG